MAYTDFFEVHSGQVDLSTTGDKFRWGPVANNFVVTGFAVTLHAASAAGVVTLATRPTYGSDTGRTTQSTLTIPTTGAAGRAYYKKLASKVVVTPGQEIVIAVTTGVTGNTSAKVLIYGYYDQEVPNNASNTVLV